MEAKAELTERTHDGDSDALETVLAHIGEMGRYQKWLFVAMLPFGFIFSYVYFVQMFIAATPKRHWCKVPGLEHLDLELRRNLTTLPREDEGWERCATFDTNWSSVLETLLPPGPNTSTVACSHGWEFELIDIPYHTVVSERQWVCEFAGYAPLAQSAFFAGAFLGGLIFGWMGDRFGRIPALVCTNLLGFVGGIGTIFTSGLWDFTFCRFLVGMCYDSCFILMYILVLEYVGPSHRTWVANMSIALFTGTASTTLPWLALWIGDWRRLVLVTSLPMLLVIGAPFLIPESARWLASRGRVHQAVAVLQRFEKVNKTKVPPDVMDDFVVSSGATRTKEKSMSVLMKSPPLRATMILMMILYIGNSIVFDGLVRMTEALGLNFFLTFSVTAVTELPSAIVLVLVFDRWGRRLLTCGPLVASGILALIMAIVPKGIPQVSLAVLARFFVNITYSAAIQWPTEMLPTAARATGCCAIYVSGYIATVVSPFIVYSGTYWAPLPLLILGVISISAGAVGIFLPETKGRPMPQTLADGERLVWQHSLWGRLHRRKAKDNEDEEWNIKGT